MQKQYDIEVDLVEIIGKEKAPLTYSTTRLCRTEREAFDFARQVCDGEMWHLATGDAIRVVANNSMQKETL